MDPHAHLSLAAAAFLVLHGLPSSRLRDVLVRALGEGPYLLVFSIASTAGIVWMAYAYAQAPVTPLWPGIRILPALVMPFAAILVVCGVLTPNPSAVAQGRLLASAQAARGIVRVTRHPVMWGIMLWSGSHLLAIGSVRATLFFGSLLVLAAAGTRMQDVRKARAYGEDWVRFAATTSNLPFAAIAQGRNRFVWSEIGLVRTIFGLLAYGGVAYYHAALFGAAPF